MPAAPIPLNDEERVQCLEAYSILDSTGGKVFDDIVLLASQICGASMAIVTLVDRDRQWFLARLGLEIEQTPREQAFCGYTILENEFFLVEDAQDDDRFVENPLVTGRPNIRFYAGIPLKSPTGFALGSLCVLDQQKMTLSQQQLLSLSSLASIVMSLIEARQVSGKLADALGRVDKQALQMAEQERRFQAVFECQTQLVGIVTPQGLVERANHAAVVATGAPRTTYQQFPLWELPFWQHDPKVRQLVQENLVVAQSGQVAKFETTYQTNGTTRWGQFSITPFRDQLGAINFLVAEGHDVDDLKQAQAVLEAQNHQLEELNRQKNLLLGMAAHDLRNPLSVVLGYSRFITHRANEGVPDKVLGFVKSIEKSANTMLALIEDLLDVSTFESGKLTLKSKSFDLRHLVEEVGELNKPMAEAKEIAVSLTYPLQPVMVVADPVKINQVLTNLFTNAIKYSERNTSVSIALAVEGQQAKISVQDQGPGMSSEEQAQLFQPFGRVARLKTTGGESSTGLGLAIARRIIEGHDGQIDVISQPGQGSNFWFTLPLADQSA